MYSKFPAITKTTPANHVPEILQPHSSTNPDGSHMYNYICQIEVDIKYRSKSLSNLFKCGLKCQSFFKFQSGGMFVPKPRTGWAQNGSS